MNSKQSKDWSQSNFSVTVIKYYESVISKELDTRSHSASFREA